MSNPVLKVALAGNPNSGKSTLFNRLTGLDQKIANFPGVTVEKRTGRFKYGPEHTIIEVVDLPGTYSLYPKTPEEQITAGVLNDPANESYPDVTIVVVDGTNIKRGLFLCTQVVDLERPCILAINMYDLVRSRGERFDTEKLAQILGIPVVAMNAREGDGIGQLKDLILTTKSAGFSPFNPVDTAAMEVVQMLKKQLYLKSDYSGFQFATNPGTESRLDSETNRTLEELKLKTNFQSVRLQSSETLRRYEKITGLLPQICFKGEQSKRDDRNITRKLDDILLHGVFGYGLFLLVMFLMFQAVFAWAKWPMGIIDDFFTWLSAGVSSILPQGVLNDLLVDGVLAGLGGVVIFIPQIALLFLFITILEDTGYMARVSFIMDKILRRYGLNGRSVIPMISGVACAVPAILSARTIGNRKEQLITILVTPLMSCSARLPVYTLLIGLIIPDHYVFGILNLQGIVLMGLYLIGFIAAIGSAWIMKFILKSKERSFFIMELPIYRLPRLKNVGYVILERIKVFVFEAGKVIVAISVVLWALASYGPGEEFSTVSEKLKDPVIAASPQSAELASEKLRLSYAGRLGSAIEPAIKPLGFDWKIGIALVTSFAAREVFVGTMSTIYSVGGNDSDVLTVEEKMKNERDMVTGKPRYDLPTGLSLMIFYAFALQCMSTLAVVKRETMSWKWPLFQFVFMGGLAYLSALAVYWTLS